MLEPSRRLYRGNHLSAYAQLGKGGKRPLAEFEIANGLEEADRGFLDEVVSVVPGGEILPRNAEESGTVAPEKRCERLRIARFGPRDDRRFFAIVVRTKYGHQLCREHAETIAIRAL